MSVYALQQEWLADAVDSIGWGQVSVLVCSDVARAAERDGVLLDGPVGLRAAQASRSQDQTQQAPGWLDGWVRMYLVTAHAPAHPSDTPTRRPA